MESLDPGIERRREELRLRVAESIQESALICSGNPYHDKAGRFTSGSSAGVSEDLTPAMARERAAITSELAAKRAATGKPPYAANSLRGMAIKEHQARIEARGETVGNRRKPSTTPAKVAAPARSGAYVPGQSPLSGGSHTANAVEARIAEMKRKTEAAAAAEAARLKEIVAARVAKAAATEAARARETAVPGEPEWLTKAKEATALEVKRRQEEIAANAGLPARVGANLSMSEGVGGLKKESATSVRLGASVIEKAGLLGDYGTVSVIKDKPGKSRNGYYQPGFNQIGLKNSLPGQAIAATFIHEYGHHIDHFHGRRLGTGDMSKNAEFTAIVRRSQAYKDIKSDANHFGSRFNSYLARPTELFARAFMQWSINKAGNSALRQELDNRRNRHWSDSDFKEISDYFDRTLAGANAGTQK